MADTHRGTHPGESKGDAPSNLARYLARPEAQFDLKEEIDKLRQTASWRETGHNAKELVKYPNLRILLVLLRPSKRIPGHKADASLSIQTIQGKIRLHLPDEMIELSAGQLLTLQRGRLHDVEAEQESAFLLTISWVPGERSENR